jgi:hypothetical protein
VTPLIQENEIITLVLGLGVLCLFLLGRLRIREIPAWHYFLASFVTLVAGFIFTVLEGFFLQDTLNFLEHVCYGVSSILLAFWCWKALSSDPEEAS